jgi:hypothetical protein
MSKSLIVTLAVLGGLVLAAFGAIGYYNSVQTVGVQKEQALNAQTDSERAWLGSYVSGLYESVGVANLKSQQMDTILKDAVTGRYQLDKSNQTPGTGGSLFSAIKEAYPTIDLSVYDRIVDYIQAKRTEYAALQAKRLDMVRDYNTWRLAGFPHNVAVGLIGFPSQNLSAIGPDGKTMVHGQAALDQMSMAIVPGSVNAGYGSGTMEPLPIPGLTQTPAPANKK